MNHIKIIHLAIITLLVLSIPFVAMQFNAGVNWSAFDFIFVGALIFGTGLIYQLIAPKGGNTAYRGAVALALGTLFLLVWINGAVGIIGSEDNPANLLYFAVFATLFLGSIMARLEAGRMVRVLFLTALVHALVPVTAFVFWRPDFSPGVAEVVVLNAFFVVLWIGSALLFQQAILDNFKKHVEEG